MKKINSQRLEEILETHEGFRPHPYRCPSGKLTIGIGRNLENKGISKHEALIMLGNDINDNINYLRKILGKDVWEDLTAVRKEALIDMMMMGPGSFRTFDNLIKALKNKQYYKASREVLNSEYAEKVGQRAVHISNAIKNNKWDLS